ncbi:MAG: prolyl-tRNA synthetase associated domain-containing protein [Clostridia bacterium]|nr:prolyl-tRNA synthetase associated domain-containing protein [Clostridia bacterium]
MDKKEQILTLLRELPVEFDLYEHAAVFTMDDLPDIVAKLNTPLFRNLFLCNRQKTEFYLLMIVGDKPFRTAEVSKKLGVSRLSFADEGLLFDLLGVTPGCVNPLSLLFDTEHKVRLLIDRDITAWPRVAMHPGVNTATVAMESSAFFGTVLPRLGHEPTLLDITGVTE